MHVKLGFDKNEKKTFEFERKFVAALSMPNIKRKQIYIFGI